MINCPWCGERIIIPQLDYNLYLENITELQNKIDKAIEYIIENYSNEDDTIWHEGFKKILDILKGE